MRMASEECPKVFLGLTQHLLGFLAERDVVREGVEGHPFGILGTPESELDREAVAITILGHEFVAPTQEGLLTCHRQAREALEMAIGVAFGDGKDNLFAPTSDRF